MNCTANASSQNILLLILYNCRKLHRVILDRKDPNLLFKVPTILWRLVDFLIDQRALEVQNLFLLSGTEQFCNMIQDSLDLHEPFPEEISILRFKLIN